MMKNGYGSNDFLGRMHMAFLISGVQYKLACDTMSKILEFINRNRHVAPHNKPRIFQRAIYLEVCKLLDSGKPSFTPRKGKTSVVMFVGLQGSGKTTTCTKYAHYHHNKGWKPALVRTGGGAFDHLEQNAKVQIPSFGSYMESDAVRVAVQGVEKFKKENLDLIIVDTSRRHKQETALFDEMHHMSEAIKPDLVILVVDSNIGQAALDHAQAFKQKVVAGAVILTKMDGHAAGGGALSAVAAAKTPVIFTETGENMDEFEFFDLKPFVRCLLGMGDKSGLMNKNVQEVVQPVDQQPKHMLGPMGQIFSMLPACSHEMMPTPNPTPTPTPLPIPQVLEKESLEKFKRCMTVLNSMTEEELDGSKPLNASRIERLARGSGRHVRNIMEMLEDVKHLAKSRKDGII